MIFELFALNYQYWQYGKSEKEVNAARNLWLTKLKHVDFDRCSEAANKAVEIYKKSPTIAEFLELTKREPAHQDYQALPRPPTNESIANREIAKMREVLKNA